MSRVLHWLLCGSLTTQLKPHKALKNMKKRLEGAALKLPPGLTRPDPANPSSEKMTSQPTFFCCMYFPKSVIKLHRLFHASNRNTHFDIFFKMKAWMGVKYFFVYVRKHKSNLSTNICTTVGKKTQWYAEKCELLSETPFSPYFMMAWWFLLPKCVFFYQWCFSCFSSQQYVSVIFVKQCW